MTARKWLVGSLLLFVCLGSSCPQSDQLPNGGDSGDSGNANQAEVLKFTSYATKTGGATGLAIRPSDGKLFAVNSGGVFGPIEQGDDLSTTTAIGGTNLQAASIFNGSDTTLALAITDVGEFWIGSTCCSRVAVVSPAGGNSAAFDGLLSAPSHPIKPTALALVPAGFDGPDIDPGNLLAGENTSFSFLSAINVTSDTVVDVPNPSLGTLNREAQHLAFGPGPVLYGSRGVSSPTIGGLQTIDSEGTPTTLAGTLNLGVKSFVVRSNGDLVMLGRFDTAANEHLNGVLVYVAATQQIKLGVGLTTAETVEGGELAISADRSTIFLSLPVRNEIVTVSDK